eukprot:m.206111 g.206111  ORF g.206111 m.206111 type:complete len:83 (+) comp32940_c0_seq2:910-1158(+)
MVSRPAPTLINYNVNLRAEREGVMCAHVRVCALAECVRANVRMCADAGKCVRAWYIESVAVIMIANNWVVSPASLSSFVFLI